MITFGGYIPYALWIWVERETDAEFDPILWRDDPDMDTKARDERDDELALDLTGNLDAPL